MGMASTSQPRGGAANPPASDGVALYFALACGITWLLAVPTATAWMGHKTPAPWAVACEGLSAFGPLFAALLVAGPRRQLRDVFGRWRTNPLWIALALLAPVTLHLVATAVYAVFAGPPAAWFHPPINGEQWAALVVFPLGEEFGWRGFAHSRMVRAHGLVTGSLLVGAVWGLWHLAYSITPAAAGFDAIEFGMTMIELPLYALIIAWVFERANRSMAVAIAFHAGAHLDHIERAPRANPGLHVLHLAVVAVVAVVLARSMGAQQVRAQLA